MWKKVSHILSAINRSLRLSLNQERHNKELRAIMKMFFVVNQIVWSIQSQTIDSNLLRKPMFELMNKPN